MIDTLFVTEDYERSMLLVESAMLHFNRATMTGEFMDGRTFQFIKLDRVISHARGLEYLEYYVHTVKGDVLLNDEEYQILESGRKGPKRIKRSNSWKELNKPKGIGDGAIRD